MKKYLLGAFALLFAFVFSFSGSVCFAADSAVCGVQIEKAAPFDVDCASALLMDSASGTVLYEKNADAPLPPASVTKIMTLLLTMEAVDSGKLSLDDELTVSEYAASMGGSQVYLEPGEKMKMRDLLKSVVVASANDAAVTLAEAVAGSETGFIVMMNEKAAELGMSSTHFENATGLDDTAENHLTSARDIAIMSRELIEKHPAILEYSSIWMDSIRDGAFGLTNTNRLIRFYNGATGLKTGSTSKAKFCISATAKRDGLHLIAVIMGAPTRDVRNEAAKKLLDYGFANYALYSAEAGSSEPVKVVGGVKSEVKCGYDAAHVLLSKGDAGKVEISIEPLESVSAPVNVGDECGRVYFKVSDKTVYETPLVCTEQIPKIGFFDILKRIAGVFCFS